MLDCTWRKQTLMNIIKSSSMVVHVCKIIIVQFVLRKSFCNTHSFLLNVGFLLLVCQLGSFIVIVYCTHIHTAKQHSCMALL